MSKGTRLGVLALITAFGSASQALAQTPTFTKDIAPIFQEKCESCHRPESIAPMSLRTYEEARPWARSIKTRVSTRQMPPWHIDRSIGEYLEDPSLSDAEIATIVTWIDVGAPQGNPSGGDNEQGDRGEQVQQVDHRGRLTPTWHPPRQG